MQDRQATPGRIDCGESLTIARVTEFHAQLCAALDAGQPVTLDASQLARVDGAALQLLTAFARGARDLRVPLTWHAPHESFVRAAQLTGLGRELGLPGQC